MLLVYQGMYLVAAYPRIKYAVEHIRYFRVLAGRPNNLSYKNVEEQKTWNRQILRVLFGIFFSASSWRWMYLRGWRRVYERGFFPSVLLSSSSSSLSPLSTAVILVLPFLPLLLSFRSCCCLDSFISLSLFPWVLVSLCIIHGLCSGALALWPSPWQWSL